MPMTDAEILEAALDGTLVEDDGQIEEEGVEASVQETAVAKAPTDGQPEAKPTQEQAVAADTEVEGAPILSKSGGYTIPYQKLTDARAERDALRVEVETLRQQIGTLTTQQQQNLAAAQAGSQDRADAGQAQTQADVNLAAATQSMAQGVDLAVFGDFSEEGVANGVAELSRRAMEQAQSQLRAEFDATLKRELAPLREERQERANRDAQTASSEHTSAILQAHPQAYEIVESAEFEAWQNSLPAFSRAGVEHALERGDANAVIEVFDAFVAGRPQPQPVPTPQASPEAQKPRVPNSLSEVPGAAPLDEMQQTLAMTGNSGALLDRMSSMTSDQLDALMDRI